MGSVTRVLFLNIFYNNNYYKYIYIVITHADDSRESNAFSGVCVCLCVCLSAA